MSLRKTYPARGAADPADPPARLNNQLLERALRLLARREHSRFELGRKLARHARSLDEINAVLAELESRRYLSEERFAEGLIHRYAAKYGDAFIRHSLRQHQLPEALIADASASLRQSEEARARALWERRFTSVSTDPRERLRQMRFLADRGFSHDLIRRIVCDD
jgi:regulatory protein